MKTGELCYTFYIDGDYVVMNEIEQNTKGNVFCLPYSDNGKLMAEIFDNQGHKLNETLDLNEICDMDEDSKPILGFQNPMVTACFNHEDNIFIGVHHRALSIQYNFIYSYKDGG